MSNLVPNQTEAKSWFIVNNGFKELRLKVIYKNKNKEMKNGIGVVALFYINKQSTPSTSPANGVTLLRQRLRGEGESTAS